VIDVTRGGKPMVSEDTRQPCAQRMGDDETDERCAQRMGTCQPLWHRSCARRTMSALNGPRRSRDAHTSAHEILVATTLDFPRGPQGAEVPARPIEICESKRAGCLRVYGSGRERPRHTHRAYRECPRAGCARSTLLDGRRAVFSSCARFDPRSASKRALHQRKGAMTDDR
jgi:hypothetical protein